MFTAPLVLLCTSLLWFFPLLVSAQASTTCSASVPCYQGCCSAEGNCGFGPDFCGNGCQSNCNATAECGQYAPQGQQECPLNVCCSQWGYCGTTDDFCNAKCQSHCEQPTRPSCAATADVSQYTRIVGYYELFAQVRECDIIAPEDIAVGPLTHINMAFGFFDSKFEVTDTAGDFVRRVSFLKARYAGLRVNIAIGGWEFNDPPTQNLFSNMVSSSNNRLIFITSLVKFIQKYGLDGVDIDWEYPAATDRGGNPADTANYVALMSEIREAFDYYNPAWEATITIPTSYWYLRGFDLPGLQKHVSWFNLMSYDLHGGWDQHNRYTGPYLEGHTNVTEIEDGLDLLWRNSVLPQNVVMGYAFYGRSFTMADSSCSTPGCKFSTTGRPGDCSSTAGVLLYSEIVSRNASLDVQTFYDPVSTVKYNVYDGDQWVSYDDAQSFHDKKLFMSGRCLGGLMIWALDQDTSDYQALAGLLGESTLASSLLEGGAYNNRTASALSSAFGAYTGQNCYVTPTCTDGTAGQQSGDQVCMPGYISMSTAHAPFQAPGQPALNGQCSEGWYRHICCPEEDAPKNCQWNGLPSDEQPYCTGKCGSTQFLLNADPFYDASGDGQCYSGQRSLCCDGTGAIDECYWTDCQGPVSIITGKVPFCPSGFDTVTYRYDQDNGDWCSAYFLGDGPGVVHGAFARAFCCPHSHKPKKCHWSNDPQPGGVGGRVPISTNPDLFCKPQPCNKYETQFTKAMIPPVSPEVANADLGFTQGSVNCAGYPLPPGFDTNFPFCCEPPSKYSDDWPVDPAYLFSTYYDQAEDDVLWHYSDNYQSNDADTTQADPDSEDGTDAYGFVMIDGPPGSIDSTFDTSHTIVSRDTQRLVKKSIVSRNQSVIDATFDHSEETVLVYCNFAEHSDKCRKAWYRGVEDTIIKLPTHIGEGPFARIVSMSLVEAETLPSDHIKARLQLRNTNPVYRLTFDYNFHLSKRSDPIEMRVDFTNLLDYWGEMTNTPANSKRSIESRSVSGEHLSKEEWHDALNRAKDKHKQRRRPGSTYNGHSDFGPTENRLVKRWYGVFVDWLKRLTTFESKEVGYLTLGLQKSLLLFSATAGCIGQTFFATIRLFFDTQFKLDATYAYYFSGTILPPSTPSTYVYFGLEPSAYMGLRLVGNARLQPQTDRKKLIDTITYPGLSIKGLAAVGPTLDLYGQIVGVVQLKGEMRAGVQVNFKKTEVYWPQDSDASSQYEQLLGIGVTTSSPSTQIEPTFDVSVAAEAQLDVLITPQASMGIQIGGTFTGGSIVNAQLYGQVPTDLRFFAKAQGSTSSSGPAGGTYQVGVYFLYNVVFGGVANILGLATWAIGDRQAYTPSPQYTIYEHTGSLVRLGSSKRRSSGDTEVRYPRRALFDAPLISALDHNEHTAWEEGEYGHNVSWTMTDSMLLGKRDDPPISENGNTDIGDITVGRPTCPAGDKAQVTLPDFRCKFFCESHVDHLLIRLLDNCQVFRKTIVNPGNIEVPGICTGISQFYLERALVNSGQEMTWESSQRSQRRNVACPKDFCANANNQLPQGAKVSCDEFPFASTEEGGIYMASVGNGEVSASCVPIWQQQMQSSCNKLLNNLDTNVAYFEREARKDTATLWASWANSANRPQLLTSFLNSKSTWSEGTVTVPQRIVTYPYRIPQAIGITQYEAPQNGQYYGYMFRRNFTFGLANIADGSTKADADSAWVSSGTGPNSWSYIDPTYPKMTGPTPGDMTQVACAINTFGQDEIYRFDPRFNAFCWSGEIYTATGFGSFWGVGRCFVDFSSTNTATGSQKRAIGEFNGWKIYGVKLLENDPEAVEVPSDFVPPGPLIPAERVPKFGST